MSYKVVLLTNILSPYRKVFFDALYSEFASKGSEFYVVVMAAGELNRKWEYEQFSTNYTHLLSSKTITIKDAYFHFSSDLNKIIREIAPDIVIASGSYLQPTVWQTFLLKRHLNFKLYFWSESHLNEKKEIPASLTLIREKVRAEVYSRFDGFWFAGKFSKELINQYAIENINYIFVPNLIEESKFNQATIKRNAKNILKNKWGIPDDKFIFICPARLTTVKGILPFLKIYHQIKNKDDTLILIAGDGEKKGSIENYITKNNLNVKLLGYKSEEEMIELYALSDVFLMPSLSDPNPLSTIEALWAGLPLFVSTHVGNYPEAVKEGSNGYVFNYNEEKEAIAKLEKIIQSSSNWKKSASNQSIDLARKYYEKDSTIKKIVRETLTVIV